MYATVARFSIRQRRAAGAVGLAYTTSGGRGPPASAPDGDASRTVITVGSFDFPESVPVACLYAAPSARGYPVRVLPDLGSRELVHPALVNHAGLISGTDRQRHQENR